MSIIWTADMDIALFYSMIDHKPVGENKHLHMIFIYEKFNNLNEKKLTTTQIWERLEQLYDLKELNENEGKPFPNEEVDFTLPDSIRKTSSQNSPGSESTTTETPKSVLRSKNNKTNEAPLRDGASSLFKTSLLQEANNMDTDRENSTTNSPKNENSSVLNSSSSQNNQKDKSSVNDLSNNDNSSNNSDDMLETSSRASRLSMVSKTDARNKKAKTAPVKQSKSESKAGAKKRK